MSDFEFISIILSIVVGLAITRVLAGLASVVEHRGQLRLNWVSIAWAVDVLMWLVVFWLGVVNSTRDSQQWTFGSFGILLLLAIGLYFSAALILPSRIDSDTDLFEHFGEVRRPFFTIFVAWGVLSTVMPGLEGMIAAGPSFWIGQAATVAVGLLGLATDNRRVHVTIVIISLTGMLALIVARLYVI